MKKKIKYTARLKKKNRWVKCLPFDPVSQNYSALQFKEVCVQYFDLTAGDAPCKANEASGREILDRNVETLCQVQAETHQTSPAARCFQSLNCKRHRSCWKMYIQAFQKYTDAHLLRLCFLGLSILVQWLIPNFQCFHCRGCRFGPWSGY